MALQLGWVHLQLVSPHDVEHSFQVCKVTIFVMNFHGDIINIAFYGVAYMLMEDRIYGALICRTDVLQAKGHYLLAQRPIALVSMMINSCSYSTNDFVFI